jgi:SAM-dependent methyltransferase
VYVRNYWNRRFSEEGRIWGECPSRTAVRAVALFRTYGVQKVLVPGAGYGRHTDYLTAEGFTVHGIEISDVAIGLAARGGKGLVYYRGSILDMPFSDDCYDAVYCFNVLHLFRATDRHDFIGKCADQLRPGGVVYFTVFSDGEPTYGKGEKVEEGTYESKPGRPVHYFTEADLRNHFAAFEILETGLAEDAEQHGEEGLHTHLLRTIAARKT